MKIKEIQIKTAKWIHFDTDIKWSDAFYLIWLLISFQGGSFIRSTEETIDQNESDLPTGQGR